MNGRLLGKRILEKTHYFPARRFLLEAEMMRKRYGLE